MRTRAGWLFVLVLSLAAAACGSSCRDDRRMEEASAPPILAEPTDDRPKVVALGDSLTAGYGLVESQSYPALLQQKVDEAGLEFEVVNAGVSGDTSAGGLRRLDWLLKEGNVQVLIVALGANDGLRGLSIGEMTRNLEAIVTTARERDIVVVLAGMEAPPNYGPEYATAFRQAYQDVARRQRVLFIPFLLDKVAGESALNQADGIHPNAQGTAIVAETVWKVLQPVLEQIANS